MTTRSRSTGKYVNQTLADFKYVKARFGGCGNAITEQTTAYAGTDIAGSLRTMTDVVTKGYRRLSAQGTVIVNPMFWVETTINPLVGNARLAYHARTIQCSGESAFQTHYDFPCWAALPYMAPDFNLGVDGHWAAPAPLVSALEYEKAILEACTIAHDERGRSPANFWETIAERKQTYAMLGDYLKQANELTYRMETDVVKRRMPLPKKLFKASGKIANAAASSWLITRYGLSPLIEDIRLLRTQLSNAPDETQRHTARGSAVVSRSSQSVIDLSWDGDLTYSLTRFGTDEVTVRAMSLDEWKYGVLDHFGLGTKGLVTLPWEILTLSFVADWFANFGRFIGALVPTPGVKQLGSCYVVKRTRSLTSTIGNFSPVAPAILTGPGGLTKTATRVTKERIPGIRSPSLIVLNRSKIDPAVDRNTSRIVDTTALVAQRLMRVHSYLSKLPF